jgi:hypothetical protein
MEGDAMNFKEQSGEIVWRSLGAMAGGVLGFFAFEWLFGYGYYALMLPVGGVGFGGGLFARRTSVVRAILCSVAGLALGIYTEWHFRPFAADAGFGYFLAHLHQLESPTWIMLFVGALLSFWLGYGRSVKRET